jgi:hypothetical protein
MPVHWTDYAPELLLQQAEKRSKEKKSKEIGYR